MCKQEGLTCMTTKILSTVNLIRLMSKMAWTMGGKITELLHSDFSAVM